MVKAVPVFAGVHPSQRLTQGTPAFHPHVRLHYYNHSVSFFKKMRLPAVSDWFFFLFDKDASDVWKQDHGTSLVRVTACSLPSMATFINSGKSNFKVTSLQDPSPLISYHADTWTPVYKNLESHTHEVRASVIMKTSDVTTSWHVGSNDLFCYLQEKKIHWIGFDFYFLSSWFYFFDKRVFSLDHFLALSLLNWSNYFAAVTIFERTSQHICN